VVEGGKILNFGGERLIPGRGGRATLHDQEQQSLKKGGGVILKETEGMWGGAGDNVSLWGV